MFFAVFVAMLVLLAGTLILATQNAMTHLSTIVLVAVFVFFGTIIYSFVGPHLTVGAKINSIRTNLPLAVLGMSSVAESGAPPEAMFTTASVKEETPHLNKEFSKIIYYTDQLGISLLEAMNLVAERTPSFELKKLLIELKSNLESGGSLSEFMKKKAEHAEFEYNLMLDSLNKKAETFGDIYSALVIAGPLFLFSGVMLLGMVGGGGFAGLSITSLLAIGVFGIVPIINIIFLAILEMLS